MWFWSNYVYRKYHLWLYQVKDIEYFWSSCSISLSSLFLNIWLPQGLCQCLIFLVSKLCLTTTISITSFTWWLQNSHFHFRLYSDFFQFFIWRLKKKKNNPPQKKTPKVITTKAWFIIFSAFPPKLVYAQYTWTQRLIMISFKSCYLCYLISFPTELQWIVQSSWFYLNIYLIHLILSCLHYSHHLRPSSHHLPHALLQSLLNTLLDSILATLKFILHRGHRLLKMQIS